MRRPINQNGPGFLHARHAHYGIASTSVIRHSAPRAFHAAKEALLAFIRAASSLRALMDKPNKAVLTDLQAFDIESLEERLAALRRFL